MTTTTAQKQIFQVGMYSPTMGQREWLVEAETGEEALQKIACEKMQRDIGDVHEDTTDSGKPEWHAGVTGTKWTLYARQARIES